MTPTPVPARAEHVTDLVSVFANSFFEEETTTHVLPDPIERQTLIPVLASILIDVAMRCGHPFVIDNPVRGGSLWYAPDQSDPDEATLIATGFRNIEERVGTDVARRFYDLFDFMDEFCTRRAPTDHWYLALIGVDPACQRQGLGEALMQPVFDIADATGMPCILETATPSNVLWYSRRGFSVIAEEDHTESNLHFWLMQRNPS